MERAMEYQNIDLKRWKTVLLPDVYAKLEAFVADQNKRGVTDPYQVCRGQDLDQWVSNYMYAHCPAM
jgi:hypothetical protein